MELLVVESFAERGVAIPYVAARIARRTGRGRKLLQVAVRPLRDERLRVDLERQVGIERVGDPHRHAELLLLEM